MRIHLVTYATPRFRLRQRLLGLSARLNGVVDTVTPWNPRALATAGFTTELPQINLTDRGSGYWAWKPFIISRKLAEIPDGDVVFYCDVGRRHPFKTLERPIDPFLDWMRSTGQDVMPGLLIPWKGPMSMWTKRAAFQATNLDAENTHRSSPIQASFSFWVAGPSSRSLCGEWLRLSSQAHLINDDPSPPPLEELPDFFEHRHDQSLLSLCCLASGMRGLDVGALMPQVDTQHPDMVLELLGSPKPELALVSNCAKFIMIAFSSGERLIRRYVRFNRERPEPDD